MPGFVTDEVLVPASRALRMADLREGRTPGGALHDDPLYRSPLIAWAPLTFVLPMLGSAQGGYDDLGARKYDPTLGRFISADPALETTSPQQLGGYTYAGDNPAGGQELEVVHRRVEALGPHRGVAFRRG